MPKENGSIRSRTLVEVNGMLKCNLSTLGEYLVWLESEGKKRESEMDKRIKQLMDEVVRIGSLCTQMDKRIGLRTERAEKMGIRQ